jgi:hypothetical protein
MVAEADDLAVRAGVRNVRWRVLRAEDLPAGLGRFRLVTFAQSFHWMDRGRVAAAVHGMLEAGGTCVHVHATTHEGVDSPGPMPHPEPPRAAIAELVRRYLGPERRAGQGVLPDGTPSGEERSYRTAGFSGPRRLELPGQLVERSADEVMPRSSPPNSPAGSRGRDGGAHFGGLIRGARASMSPVVRGRV